MSIQPASPEQTVSSATTVEQWTNAITALLEEATAEQRPIISFAAAEILKMQFEIARKPTLQQPSEEALRKALLYFIPSLAEAEYVANLFQDKSGSFGNHYTCITYSLTSWAKKIIREHHKQQTS